MSKHGSAASGRVLQVKAFGVASKYCMPVSRCRSLLKESSGVPLLFRKEQSLLSQRRVTAFMPHRPVGGDTSGCLAALADIRSAGGGTVLVKYFDIAGYIVPYFAGTMAVTSNR